MELKIESLKEQEDWGTEEQEEKSSYIRSVHCHNEDMSEVNQHTVTSGKGRVSNNINKMDMQANYRVNQPWDCSLYFYCICFMSRKISCHCLISLSQRQTLGGICYIYPCQDSILGRNQERQSEVLNGTPKSV